MVILSGQSTVYIGIMIMKSVAIIFKYSELLSSQRSRAELSELLERGHTPEPDSSGLQGERVKRGN